MDTATDDFTRASPTYQAAMRYPHKSGCAYEGFEPRHGFPWLAVLAIAALVLTVAACAVLSMEVGS
jgi:hypothetical protein